MSGADDLRRQLALLTAENDATEAAAQAKEADARAVEERRQRAAAADRAASESAARADEARAEVAAMRAYLEDFPTDTHVLRLERRVETLKEQLKAAERVASQHRAGIDAYERRHAESVAARAALAAGSLAAVDELAATAEANAQRDAAVEPAAAAVAACDALAGLAEAREAEVQRVAAAMDAAAAEERRLAAAIAEQQARVAAELPRLDAEKERDRGEIEGAWAAERDALRALHDRLFIVNREQAFHLARGTHVKREPDAAVVAAGASESEATLSARHALLAADSIRGREQLDEVREELAHVKRQAELLRGKARAAQADFDKARRAKEERLAAARKAHDDLKAEAAQLRDLKAELYQALQNIRDNPHGAAAAIARGGRTPRQITQA